MYLAMNRFRVLPGKERAFEDLWRNRESRLDETPGFVEFHLMKGPETDGGTLYASHTIWASEVDFVAWTKSENFRATHRNARSNEGLHDGRPKFEGFTVVEGA